MTFIPSASRLFRRHSSRAFSLGSSAAHGSSVGFTDLGTSPSVPIGLGQNLHTKSHHQKRQFATSSDSLSPDDAKTYILSTIGENKVTIFSKTYCPFCDRVKKLFRTLGEDAKILELDLRPDGGILQEELARMTGQRSVPNVFVHGRQVGGNDDCQALARSGKLQELLKG